MHHSLWLALKTTFKDFFQHKPSKLCFHPMMKNGAVADTGIAARQDGMHDFCHKNRISRLVMAGFYRSFQ
jgi:hypothetical protein